MNKEEAFEFISRMDWMHPKMKEACKVVEHELFRPKQEPPIDIELSDSLKAKLKEYAEKVASEMYEEYKQKKIAENNNSCPNDSNNWIQSPLDEDSDLISIQGDELIFTTHEGKGRVVICKKGERFYFDKKLINNLGEHEHIRNLIFKFNENKNAGRFYHLDFPNGEPKEAGLAKEEEKKEEDNLCQFVSNLEQMSRCELTIFNKLKRNEAKILIFELIEKLKDINNK